MCTILLARSSPADRTKAIGYVEQAVAVLEEHGEAVEGDDVRPDMKSFVRQLFMLFCTGLSHR